jgi:hypothetical protein
MPTSPTPANPRRASRSLRIAKAHRNFREPGCARRSMKQPGGHRGGQREIRARAGYSIAAIISISTIASGCARPLI